MPPLARIAGIQEILSEEKLQTLRENGICDSKRFLATDEDTLRKRCFLPTGITAAVRRAIQAHHFSNNDHLSLRTAAELLEEERRTNEWWLSTGCDGIDDMLDGGLRAGEITELSGAPASGKTQLCIFTSIVALSADPSATVLFIDTNNSLEFERVKVLYEESDRFSAARESGMTSEHLLKRLRLLRVYKVHDLIDAILAVQQTLDNSLTAGDTSTLRVLVVDSVSTLFSSLLCISHPQAFNLMATLNRLINSVARKHKLVVITVNMSVGAYPHNPLSSFTSTTLKPALGTTWTFAPAVQMFLGVLPPKPHKTRTRIDDDGTTWKSNTEKEGELEEDEKEDPRGEVLFWQDSKGKVFPLVRRICELLRSRRTPTYRWTFFYMGDGDIISPR